jgi:methylglutaconyl-CoA hydratase
MEVFDTIAEMDSEINRLANQLSNSNPEAMRMLKNVFWQGTENWDTLLVERAEMSGKLVLSDFTIAAINSFKKK